MVDFPFAETFPPRNDPDELSTEAQADLAEYYYGKIKRSNDWAWREWNKITGLADY